MPLWALVFEYGCVQDLVMVEIECRSSSGQSEHQKLRINNKRTEMKVDKGGQKVHSLNRRQVGKCE